MVNLMEKVIIRGRIKAETGLHIGGSPTALEIGGLDNAMIKDYKGRPYIPGSSLKGKMRSLLEKSMGLADEKNRIWVVEDQKISIHMCEDPKCPLCNIFGRTDGKKKTVTGEEFEVKCTTPTRLIVRDAHLIEGTIPEEVKNRLDLEWTEVKWENVIDRITSKANPRQMERVPPEAEFDFSMVYNVFNEDDRKNLRYVFTGLQLLEDDYLGGSGSRGYGRVKFKNIEVYRNTVSDYEKGDTDVENKTPLLKGETPSAILKELEGIKW